MAELYIFNDSGWTLMPGKQKVTDQGKLIASLPRQTYTRVLVAPGIHVLHPKPVVGRHEVTLNAEAGARYYVVIGYRPERSWVAPFAGSPVIMKQLSEEEARPLLETMKPQ
jgi:hypothetical protein